MFDALLNKANVVMMISEQDPQKKAEIEKNIGDAATHFVNVMKELERSNVNSANKGQDKQATCIRLIVH